MSGISWVANSMSSTGPVTRATRPTPDLVSVLVCSFSVAVMYLSLTPSVGVGECVRTADDLADLLGNAGLAGLVGYSGVLLDQLVRVVRRRLHCPLPGSELGGARLQQAEEDPAVHVPRQQRVENLGDRRLELIQREHVVRLGLGLPLDDLQRKQPDHIRLLGEHR